MDCCLNQLGRFAHNSPINTGIITDESGSHKVYFTAPTGGTFTLLFNLEAGDELIVPVGKLNENMTYSFRVEKPSGDFIIVDDCNKFQLITIINSQIDDCTDACDETPTNYYS